MPKPSNLSLGNPKADNQPGPPKKNLRKILILNKYSFRVPVQALEPYHKYLLILIFYFIIYGSSAHSLPPLPQPLLAN